MDLEWGQLPINAEICCGTGTSLGCASSLSCSLGQDGLTQPWARLSTALGLGPVWGHFGLLLSLSIVALSQGWLGTLIQPTRQRELEVPQ